MTAAEILELRSERAKLIKQANDLLATAKTENRDLKPEEAEKFDKLHDEAERQLAQIAREERQSAANGSIEQRNAPRAGTENAGLDNRGGAASVDVQHRNLAINSWLRYGISNLGNEQRQIMEGMFFAATGDEQRAQGAATNNIGGYTVAPDTSMYKSVEQGVKLYGFPESLCTVINSGTGADLPIPTNDDTGNVGGAVTAENTDTGAATDLTLGQITLKAWAFPTGVLRASLQFIQDTSIDAEAWIGQRLGERDGRKRAVMLTTGAGTTEPKGVVTCSTLGVTAAGATAVTYNELLDLQHSVDPAHRKNGRYMFNDSTLKVLKKLTDSQGRPLFLPGTASKEPDTINGYAYEINQAMASIATGNKSILFGDFKKFVVRNVRGFGIMRLVERYAEYLQVGFVGYSRYDSNLLDAGTRPIKHLIQA